MTPVYGPIPGLLGACRLRYPGGTEYASILRTVSLFRPNTRDASLVLMPSTMQARRTRRYSSTWYIPHTFHGLLVCPYGR